MPLSRLSLINGIAIMTASDVLLCHALLSCVLRQVVMIVDEVGTEAAAVTSILAGATAFMPERITPPIVFDRPFIFMVVDDSSNTVLFMGTVRDPSKAQ